ncbi:MAG: hypothetical protein WCJ02_05580 [bacterium]
MQEKMQGKSVDVTTRSVLLFALTASLFSGPWLHDSAGQLAFGSSRDLLLNLTYPLKRVSEISRIEWMRRSVENSVGQWLNTQKKGK